ncbi:hypothetical protein ACWFMI_00550 [Nocardiopsis terrae]
MPEVQVSRPRDVPGGSYEPVAGMFEDGATGRTLVLRLHTDGYAPEEPEPWKSVPGVAEYVEQPLSDMDRVPERVVFSDDPNLTNDLMIVRSVHALVADEEIPFSESDVEESLKIEGELVENPAQWTTEMPSYVSFLLDEVEAAFS